MERKQDSLIDPCKNEKCPKPPHPALFQTFISPPNLFLPSDTRGAEKASNMGPLEPLREGHESVLKSESTWG